MKQLIDNIKQSIYGPEYYQELLTKPPAFSWKYYSAVTLALALFLTIASSIPLVPKIITATHEFPEKFFAYYPDDLEISVVKGIVSTNVVEPYFLPLPQMLKENTPASAGGSLVVIDTKTPFSLEQLSAYKSEVWIGKDQLAFREESGGVRITPLNPQMTLAINEGALRGFEKKLQFLYKFAAPLVVMVIFLGLLFAFYLNLAYLLLGAALIFFLGRVLKQRWSYGTAYRIGLHAMTLPILLDTLFSITALPLFHFRFFFTVILLAVVYANFKNASVAERALA